MPDTEARESLIAVVLLGFGAPDSPQAVRPFLENVLSDLKKRAPAVFEERVKETEGRYQEIGGFSPLPSITKKQAQALGERLELSKNSFRVYVAMRYSPPFIREVVKDISRDGVEHLIVLSLAPHYNGATAGESFKEFKEALDELGCDTRVTYIESWFGNPAYLDALAEKIKEGLAQFPGESHSKVQVIFSAHSLPQRLIEAGDPYVKQLQATISGILERVGQVSWQLAFQSGGGRGDWLGPEVGDVLENLTREGHHNVLVVPLSFICDNVEILYDLDIALRKKAESVGITNFKRASSLNCSPQLIEALAQMVLEKAHLK